MPAIFRPRDFDDIQHEKKVGLTRFADRLAVLAALIVLLIVVRLVL